MKNNKQLQILFFIRNRNKGGMMPVNRIVLRRPIQIGLYILSILFAIGFVVYSFIAETTKDINQQEQQYLCEIAAQNADGIKRTVELNLNCLEMISHILTYEEAFNIETVINILKQEAIRASFKRMGFAGIDGNAITTDNEAFNIADRTYFIEALAGQNSVSERLVDKTNGSLINVYAVPVIEKEQIIGVIFATSDSKVFADILETRLFGGEGFSYIIRQDGVPVVYSQNKNSFSEFSNLFEEIGINQENTRMMKENMAENKSGIIEYSRSGVERVGAYCTVGINDWWVVSVVPKSVISQSANQIIMRNTITVVLNAIFCIGLLLFLIVQNGRNRKHLERIAYHDELIDMPNFNAFEERAQRILTEHSGKQFVFVKLDVDKFKLINDRFGYREGDLVLKNIAKALNCVVREEGELFARIAVDEFIVMFHAKSQESFEALRQEFAEQFDALMKPSMQHYFRFPSGRYLTNPGETSMKEIFEKVNYAHRQAKLLPEKTGVSEFYYDNSERTRALRESELEDKMAAALANHEFKVYLQPKYELDHETIVGAEALVRWQDAKTLISPAEFIALFERNGFIVQLDLYMFEQVCAILKGWSEDGLSMVTISVNFSRLHLKNPHFIHELAAIAGRYGIPAGYIEIELTETAVFENIDLLEHVLQQIHEAGFTMSMDDFGTGYSSLGLLKNLSVDVIKMDRSFFTSSMHNTRTKTVVGCVISMAQKLNIHTVAEGVEDYGHIEFLKEVGCEVVQGYYYARPVPAETFHANFFSDEMC